jgi:dTDP-4-dehydrorhamnose reductase
MKVFLTGASGILGTDLQKEFQIKNHEVLGYSSKEIDIANLPDVESKVMTFKPDIIIHAAAMTNVDLCEDDKEAAIKVNVIGSHNLSLSASKLSVPIVYISSCGVYGNGKTVSYNELDATNPVTYHHYTKLHGEKRVKEHNSRFLIIRPGWLFGGSQTHRKNFVEARRKEAINNPILKSAVDKVGSPTYTLDLARQIMMLVEAEVYGTFNVVNEGSASRFDYVSEIVKNFNFDNSMQPVQSNEFPRKANMPDNEVLENMHLNLRALNQMRPWKEALKEYIMNTYQNIAFP